MRAVVADELQAHQPPSLRSGRALVRELLAGTDGDPENFHVTLAELDSSYGSQRHRHNFDQIRWVIDGRWTAGPSRVIETDEIGYFSDGTYYGGQSVSDSVVITIQFGSANGAGVLNEGSLKVGRAALASRGEFRDGVFTYSDADGRKHNRDAYEAVWEHLHGRPIEYAVPARYRDVVIMNPSSFRPQPLRPGVVVRHLGTFLEIPLTMNIVEGEVGSTLTFGRDDQQVLLALRRGRLADDTRSYPGIAAFHLGREETVRLEVEEPVQLLELRLPNLARTSAADRKVAHDAAPAAR